MSSPWISYESRHLEGHRGGFSQFHGSKSLDEFPGWPSCFSSPSTICCLAASRSSMIWSTSSMAAVRFDLLMRARSASSGAKGEGWASSTPGMMGRWGGRVGRFVCRGGQRRGEFWRQVTSVKQAAWELDMNHPRLKVMLCCCKCRGQKWSTQLGRINVKVGFNSSGVIDKDQLGSEAHVGDVKRPTTKGKCKCSL